ncbi:LysR family transcriptional regulator (plasmid) [Paracoccus versutus]|uniref:LysR family nitrogen assimilation transcriptional regulator n=1 Tax=Paracoccus versutus TaxID=34007 RepID=A0AAQ0KJV9_PARVE|nr:LysR substrate-binding domain-containing protein [Paracoccus versutus]KGJ08044.1 LysR family transcriptional regulator [Paracoccus versutus]REG34087.1 LysR family nitrogen assimilation transcriptional regulator [Paracoccus versutus]WEJ81347.1 LysR family transcriptional regulator [Paracoccus versutus]
MDIRRLYAFMKIVDIGSITRASAILHIAQPALSQQIAALETHFGKPLLLRSKRGVIPTEAGKVLYRHCQMIIRQMNQAEQDIATSSEEITGAVSVGFAPLGLGSLVATQLMRTIREKHPGILLYANEAVGGGVISEQIMTGKMDIALIFDPGKIPSLSFEPISTEELYFVGTQIAEPEDGEISFAEAVSQPLILPSPIHTVRQVIETTLSRVGTSAQVVAQTESISYLSNALAEGLGCTILPASAAQAVLRRVPDARSYRIRRPNMKVAMAICVSAQLPLSEAAAVVRDHLVRLATEMAQSPAAFDSAQG